MPPEPTDGEGASMNASPGSPPTARAATGAVYWPLWSSTSLFLTGGAIAILETDTLLFFVGLILLGCGVYGFARHRPRRLPGPAPGTPSGPTRPPVPGQGTR